MYNLWEDSRILRCNLRELRVWLLTSDYFLHPRSLHLPSSSKRDSSPYGRHKGARKRGRGAIEEKEDGRIMRSTERYNLKWERLHYEGPASQKNGNRFCKRFDRWNCDNGGLIVLKSKTQGEQDKRKISHFENELCPFRIKFEPALGGNLTRDLPLIRRTTLQAN